MARIGSTMLLLLVLVAPAVRAAAERPLIGTQPLENATADLSLDVVDRVDRFLLRETEQAAGRRQQFWSRDYLSAEKYLASVAPNRARLRRIIGVVDERVPFDDVERVTNLHEPVVVAENSRLKIYAVRWPVFAGVFAEGLWLEPTNRIVAQIICLPDADQTPEMLAGLAKADPSATPFARRLAEAGCRVLVPTLIDRQTTWSGNPRVRMTNQTHREWIYRQAYFAGRHIIGYEVQKVLAAVDWLAKERAHGTTIGVAGCGEGGLVALYAAAVDPRLDRVLVSGYFQPRENLWREPVYRNVWGLLREFGDAEIASLIAPRRLVIEACRSPEVAAPPPRDGRNDAATGSLTTPALADVRDELARARHHYAQLKVDTDLQLVVSGDDGRGPNGSAAALKTFLPEAAGSLAVPFDPPLLTDGRVRFDPAARMKRQVEQLVDFTQRLMRQAVFRRGEYWSKADPSSLEKWGASCQPYRDYFRAEIIGPLPPASLPPNPRTRVCYETDKFRGYEVVLDVWPEVIAYGMLLVPKDIQPGERRAVVVAQHGRGGRPADVCNPHEDTQAYHSFGARLAERGFIVFAPQNLYLGEEQYRQLQRKATPLKMTFFAPMVRQHEQILKWLGELPMVDSRRIGFYGLSYGGKSAMLIPAAVEGYALSICSGDFNEQVWKHMSIDDRFSFLFTLEHDHSEFDFAEKFNYAEIAAGLIAPRPFMVERGHRDGVAPDEWVAYEYAKVRRRYVELGIGERTAIEFFDGVHEIHSRGTFEFLERHLRKPQ